MECCWDELMEKLLSRTGRVGKLESWCWQLCYLATSFLLLGSYWERGMALPVCTGTRVGKSPHCTCYLARHCSSLAWDFGGGKGADFEATASRRTVNGEHHLFGAFTVSAPTLALLRVRSPQDQGLWKIAPKEDTTRVFWIPGFRKQSSCCLTVGKWINLLCA